MILQIRKFRVVYFVREEVDIACFSFNVNKELLEVGMGVEESDVLFNLTSIATQSMHGLLPWKGAREKDASFLQMLLVALSKPDAVMLDAFASTGLYYLLLHNSVVCILDSNVNFGCRKFNSCLPKFGPSYF